MRQDTKTNLKYISIGIFGVSLLVVIISMFSGVFVVSNAPISKQSVLEDDVLYLSTNQTAVDNFLDNFAPEQIAPTTKYQIVVNSIIFDSDNKQYSNSTILGLDFSKLTLTDEKGRLLDLGKVQVGFDVVSTKSDQYVEIKSEIEFYLDGVLVKSSKLYNIGTIKGNTIPLYLVDTYAQVNPAVAKRGLSFSFADEGKNWVDGSDHYFQAFIKNVEIEDKQSKEMWKFIGYEKIYDLKILYDEPTKVIIDQGSGNAIKVTKSDSSLSTCGHQNYPLVAPAIGLRVENNGKVTYLTPNPGNDRGTHCVKMELQRDTEYIISTTSSNPQQTVKLHTEKAQHNYLLSCGSSVWGYGYLIRQCGSDFGLTTCEEIGRDSYYGRGPTYGYPCN